MFSLERHMQDLTPPDWVGAMDACTEGELRFIEEQAVKFAALQHKGAAGVGRVLFAQVQQVRAVRVARQARIDAQAWAIDQLEFGSAEPDMNGDVDGLPSWSELSTHDDSVG